MSNPELEIRRRQAEEQITRLVNFLQGLVGLEGEDLEEKFVILNQEYIERKRRWVSEHSSEIPLRPGENLINAAIRVLYRGNLYLPEGYMKIIEKTDRRLQTEFGNFCPILYACQELELDTRTVCRRVFHDPYQYILTQISPQLKFDRDYVNIRPYSEQCLEIITVENFTLVE